MAEATLVIMDYQTNSFHTWAKPNAEATLVG
jgi:hypothetical protein